MLLKRTLGVAVMMYLASILIGIALSVLMDLQILPATFSTTNLLSFNAICKIGIMALGAMWYFCDPLTRPSLLGGLTFGVCIVMINFACDILAIIPHILIIKDPSEAFLHYREPLFLMHVVLMVMMAMVIGNRQYRKVHGDHEIELVRMTTHGQCNEAGMLTY